MKQTNRLNNDILITQPYGKCKESYTSVRRTAHKILFIIGRKISEMTHVDGDDDGVGYGVSGKSSSGNGVYGLSQSTDGYGVVGENKSTVGYGVYGKSNGGIGVYGEGDYANGVYGKSDGGNGVYGASNDGYGVYGVSKTGAAVVGIIKIDHPLDPANKYLCHSFVESPDMKNVYDGVVVLDNKGEAEIKLPDWFGALNKDFRYQLSAIGAPGPNLYIAEEISKANTNSSRNKNSFKIAGGKSGMKVSWQVTGIRKDPWANAHRVQVEEDKPDKERGYYIHPDLYGQPTETQINRFLFPEQKKSKARRGVANK